MEEPETKEDTQKISLVEELTETYIHWKEMIGS